MSIPPVAIITGAGSAIGREVALRLAQTKHKLCLVGRTERKLEETVELMAEDVAEPPETLMLPADIADAEQAAGVIEMAVDRFGGADVIVNNAGAAPIVAIDETDEDVLYQTFAVNTFGPAYLIGRAWPHMIKHRRGCVVNVSSAATLDPMPGFFVYGATKAALENFTRSIHVEGAQHGVRAFSVAPGAVETPLLRTVVSEEDLPTSSTLDPAEVAGVIVDCIIGRRDGETGQIIRMSPNE